MNEIAPVDRDALAAELERKQVASAAGKMLAALARGKPRRINDIRREQLIRGAQHMTRVREARRQAARLAAKPEVGMEIQGALTPEPTGVAPLETAPAVTTANPAVPVGKREAGVIIKG